MAHILGGTRYVDPDAVPGGSSGYANGRRLGTAAHRAPASLGYDDDEVRDMRREQEDAEALDDSHTDCDSDDDDLGFGDSEAEDAAQNEDIVAGEVLGKSVLANGQSLTSEDCERLLEWSGNRTEFSGPVLARILKYAKIPYTEIVNVTSKIINRPRGLRAIPNGNLFNVELGTVIENAHPVRLLDTSLRRSDPRVLPSPSGDVLDKNRPIILFSQIGQRTGVGHPMHSFRKRGWAGVPMKDLKNGRYILAVRDGDDSDEAEVPDGYPPVVKIRIRCHNLITPCFIDTIPITFIINEHSKMASKTVVPADFEQLLDAKYRVQRWMDREWLAASQAQTSKANHDTSHLASIPQRLTTPQHSINVTIQADAGAAVSVNNGSGNSSTTVAHGVEPDGTRPSDVRTGAERDEQHRDPRRDLFPDKQTSTRPRNSHDDDVNSSRRGKNNKPFKSHKYGYRDGFRTGKSTTKGKKGTVSTTMLGNLSKVDVARPGSHAPPRTDRKRKTLPGDEDDFGRDHRVSYPGGTKRQHYHDT